MTKTANTATSTQLRASDAWPFLFRDAEMALLREALLGCLNGVSRVVVVRHKEAQTQEIEKSPASGKGVGKTRLLEEFVNDVRRKKQKPEILSFTNVRQRIESKEKPFLELFSDRFFQGSYRTTRDDFRIQAFCVLGRTFLLVRLTWLVIAAILVLLSNIANITIKIGAQTLNDVMHVVLQNPIPFGIAGLLAVFFTYFGFRRDPHQWIRASWDSFRSVREERDAILDSDNPKRIAHMIASHAFNRRAFMIVVDDVESIGGIAYDFLTALYDSLTERKIAVLLLLSYDPYSQLMQGEGERITRDLENTEKRNKILVDLRALDPDDFADIVSAQYGDSGDNAREILDTLLMEITLKQGNSEIENAFYTSRRADIILGFFVFLEEIGRIQRRETWVFDGINVPEMFNEFIARERAIVEQVLQQIEKGLKEKSRLCKEVLKYTLAFKTEVVNTSYIKKLLGVSSRELDSCIAYLIGDIGLITPTTGGYRFTDPNLRAMFLATEWKVWNKDRKYTNDVFQLLVKERRLHRERHIAEQALESSPSVEAVDILIKKGVYLFNELGYTGSALHYLGGESGALAKWQSLLAANLSAGKPVGELLEWRADAITSYKPESASLNLTSGFVSAVALCRIVGQLYFLVGNTADAEKVWKDSWEEAQRVLTDLQATTKIATVNLVSGQVAAGLAFLYLLTGQWGKARRVCDSLLAEQQALLPTITFQAQFMSGLMALYREKGLNATRTVASWGSAYSEDTINSVRDALSRDIKALQEVGTDSLLMLCELVWISHDSGLMTDYIGMTHRARRTLAQLRGKTLSLLEDAIAQHCAGILLYLDQFHVTQEKQTLQSLCRGLDTEVSNEHSVGHWMVQTSYAEEFMHNPETGNYELQKRSDREASTLMLQDIRTALARLEDINRLFSVGLWQAHEKLLSGLGSLSRIRLEAEFRCSKLETMTGTEMLKVIDSLAKHLKNDIVDVTDILSTELLFQAKEQFEEAYTAYEFLNYRFGMAELQRVLARLVDFGSNRGDGTEGKDDHRARWIYRQEQSLRLREENNIVYGCAETCYELGKFYEQHGHYPKAARYLERCAEISNQLGFPNEQVGSVFGDAGLIYYNSRSICNSHEAALSCCTQALEKYRQLATRVEQDSWQAKDLRFQIIYYQRIIASLYINLGRLDDAEEMCAHVLEGCGDSKEQDWQRQKGKALVDLGEILRMRGGASLLAIEKLGQAFDIFQAIGDLHWKLASANCLLQETYDEGKKKALAAQSAPGSAIQMADIAKTLGQLASQGIIEAHPAFLEPSTRRRLHLTRDLSRVEKCIAYYTDSFDFYVMVGEYEPAYNVFIELNHAWDDGYYSDDDLSSKLRRLMQIIDVDPNNPNSVHVLGGVYVIFEFLRDRQTLKSPNYARKKTLLAQAIGLVEADEFANAVRLLQEAQDVIAEQERETDAKGKDFVPEEIDVEVLERLYEAYEGARNHPSARTVLAERRRLQSMLISSRLHQLAKHYEGEALPDIAIRLYTIAGAQRPDNTFAIRARQRKEYLYEQLGERLAVQTS